MENLLYVLLGAAAATILALLLRRPSPAPPAPRPSPLPPPDPVIEEKRVAEEKAAEEERDRKVEALVEQQGDIPPVATDHDAEEQAERLKKIGGLVKGPPPAPVSNGGRRA